MYKILFFFTLTRKTIKKISHEVSRVTVKRFEKMSIKTILALTKKNVVHGRKIHSVNFFKLCNNPTKPTPNSLHYTPRQYTLLLKLIRNGSNSRKMTTFSVENNLVFYLSSLKLLDWFISSLQTSFRSCLVLQRLEYWGLHNGKPD